MLDKADTKTKDKGMIAKYVKKMTFELFLETYETKQYGLLALSRLVNVYLMKEPLTNEAVRCRVAVADAALEDNDQNRQAHAARPRLLHRPVAGLRVALQRVRLRHRDGRQPDACGEAKSRSL